ncbi:putative TPR-repeat protein [Trypanosoma cruzi Dm28c]|uniref:Putative TPR-repeat protein n=1 Tax=Trypanosoma cruzi Dm28c TaxID=1416333 RepID=V5ANZ2_TRYCR|nr:putative TPR-repeat protein [Trypanosoma cruzi Dm28c]
MYIVEIKGFTGSNRARSHDVPLGYLSLIFFFSFLFLIYVDDEAVYFFSVWFYPFFFFLLITGVLLFVFLFSF